jgi:hypothetical protein
MDAPLLPCRTEAAAMGTPARVGTALLARLRPAWALRAAAAQPSRLWQATMPV